MTAHLAAPGPVVLVGPLPPPHHGQSVLFALVAEEMARRGVPHRVVDIGHGEKSAARLGTLTVHRLREYLFIVLRFLAATTSRRSTVYLTIAQSRAGFLRDCLIIWLSALRGHRVVGHLHGGNYDGFYRDQPRWLRAVVRATLRRTELLLVLGERLRGMFDFDPALAPRIRVVPNGLAERLAPREQGKALPPAGPVRLLFLSNLVESKGYFDVLEAVRLLRDRLGPGRVRCDFHGYFATNPADDVRVRSVEQARELFDAFVRDHGLEEEVRYRGVATGEEKVRALEEAHIFVLPTGYSNEGQPLSIIEAMAFGNVVVATPFRAIPEVVEDGVTGILVPYGDAAAVAGAVAALLRDPARYAAMSRAAVERYARRFTREAHLGSLLPFVVGSGDRPGLEVRSRAG